MLSCLILNIKGMTFCINGIVYRPISDKTVTVIKVFDNDFLIIPENVTFKSITYTITDISKGAFYALLKTRTIILPASIKHINCRAFDFCKELSNIYISAKEPPVCHEEAFSRTDLSSCTLHVPDESRQKYKESAPWNKMIMPQNIDKKNTKKNK